MRSQATNLRQVTRLTWANMKSRYRKTFAGLIWVIMNPILMYGAQSLAIKHFLKLDLPNFYIFLLGGLLPWIFIIQTLSMTTPLFVTNGQLLKSFKINPLVLLYSQILDNFINFMLPFFIIFIPLWFQGSSSSEGIYFLPIALVLLILGTLGMCLILSLLQVFFRDTSFVVTFITGVMFFLTPIFYPISYVPEKYRFLVSVNPFYVFIEPVRSTIYNFNLNHMLLSFSKSLAFGILFITIGLLFWKSKKNAIYYHI